MAYEIQLRHDTAANWTSANPTLAQGEAGYETDTGKLKVGDGSTAWTGLAYFGGSGTVNSLTAADTSIVVAGTASSPTVRTGTLDTIATQHPPTAAVALNSQKITGLANGTLASDAAAFGQIPTALPPNGSAGGDLSGTYPNPTVAAVQGVAVSGTAPTAGQVLTASDATHAAWATGGGGSSPLTTKGDIYTYSTTGARLAVGLDKQVLTANSAATTGNDWEYPPGYEINYTEITSPANITDTSEATGTALISPGAVTFDGGPVLVSFFTMGILADTAAASDFATVTLFEGSTEITRLAQTQTLVTTATHSQTVTAHYRFTPSAGSHTYKVCGFVPSTTGTPRISAGAGGTNGNPPAFIRFTKV